MILKTGNARPLLVHAVHDLRPDGKFNFLFTLAGALRAQYAHTLMYETPPEEVDMELLMHAQAAGLDTLSVDCITAETIAAENADLAILYNIEDRPKAGTAVPSMYYSYGIYDPDVEANIAVPCSKYACTHRRNTRSSQETLSSELVIEPMIQDRMLGNIKPDKHPFTVSILTSGAYDKYPCTAVMELMSKLPEDIITGVTVLPAYKHPGVEMAIEERSKRTGKVRRCPVKIYSTMRYMLYSDVIIYDTSEKHDEPYGRLVNEAMAMGKPVVCRRTGIFAETLEHGIDALLYDDIDTAVNYVEMLRNNKDMRDQLEANGKMKAAWHGVSAQIGRLKSLLRKMG